MGKLKTTKLCEICKSTFTTRQVLSRHRKSIHEGKIAGTCNICNKDFKRKDDLNAHTLKNNCGPTTMKMAPTSDITPNLYIRQVIPDTPQIEDIKEDPTPDPTLRVKDYGDLLAHAMRLSGLEHLILTPDKQERVSKRTDLEFLKQLDTIEYWELQYTPSNDCKTMSDTVESKCISHKISN